jgi:hypothetical protein
MHIKFIVDLECRDDADQNELRQEVEVALESSFLLDKGAISVKITQEQVS